jgi:hypothetical protein
MSENTSTTDKNKESVFEIDLLVAETYNSIAQWHNEEPGKESLKQLSLEIVEKIAGATLNHIGLKGNLSIYKDEEIKKKIAEMKKDEE